MTKIPVAGDGEKNFTVRVKVCLFEDKKAVVMLGFPGTVGGFRHENGKWRALVEGGTVRMEVKSKIGDWIDIALICKPNPENKDEQIVMTTSIDGKPFGEPLLAPKGPHFVSVSGEGMLAFSPPFFEWKK